MKRSDNMEPSTDDYMVDDELGWQGWVKIEEDGKVKLWDLTRNLPYN